MATLTGKKRKQKWSLNHPGKNWSKGGGKDWSKGGGKNWSKGGGKDRSKDNFNEPKLNKNKNGQFQEQMVGEVGKPDGENELLPSGEIKLKLKYAKFGKLPPWANKKGEQDAKKSYKHLIKGDIVLSFYNTNLHDIRGYALDSLN